MTEAPKPKESVRLNRMQSDVGNAEILDKIQKDPIEAGLFQQYVGSLSPAEQAKVLPMLRKVLNREGTKPEENLVAQETTRSYIERKRKAELVNANLNDKDVKQLGEILAKRTSFIKPDELPLYILGLGVRGSKEFDELVRSVQDWKQSARDKVAEKKTERYEQRLSKLATQWGVSQEEVDRLIQLPDDKMRYAELEKALGTTRGADRIWNASRRAVTGRSRAAELQGLIQGIRLESDNLMGGLNNVLAALGSFDTGKDVWWNNIPDAVDMFKKQRDANVPPEQKPVSLSEAREMSSPKEVAKQFEAEIGKIPDGRNKFEQAKKSVTPSNDVWSTQVDVGGGQMKSWGEIYGGVTKNIDSTIKSRGLIGKLLEILFGPMMLDNFKKAKKQLQGV